MASTNLISKISRAVAHYLVIENAVPFERCYPITTRLDRTFDNGPIVSTAVEESGEISEGPGNHRYKLRISIKGAATKNPEDTNPETERIAFDAMVGAVKDKILVSDDDGQSLLYTCRAINTSAYQMPIDNGGTEASALFAQNNADMNEFTIMWLENPNIILGPAEDCSWETLIELDAIACESQVAGYAN